MSNVILPKESVVSIANAIRNKTNSTDLLYVNEMPAAIESISGDGEISEEDRESIYNEGYEAGKTEGGLNLDNVGTRVFSDRCSSRDIEAGSRDNSVQGEISPVLYDLSDLNNIVAYDSYDIHLGSLESLLNDQIQNAGITGCFTEEDAKYAWDLYSSGDITVESIENFVPISDIAEYYGMFTYEDLDNKSDRIMSSDTNHDIDWTSISSDDYQIEFYCENSYDPTNCGLVKKDYLHVDFETLIPYFESAGYTVTKND